MKELDFINIIKQQIGSSYIGDDCAYLKELGIVISQDSLVENIHFKRAWATPFQLGYKSIAVNISDILASGAKPAYVTVALSLPNNIDGKFVEEFYKGAKTALHGAEIIGGDITGSERIFISVTAIGITAGRCISSRSSAKPGYKIITRGKYGLSSAGLNELILGGENKDLIQAHLEPELDEEFSRDISKHITQNYAMMDTSDGLADALFKIAEASGVSIECNEIDGMFGAEDYHLVAAVPQEFDSGLDGVYTVGEVYEKRDFVLKINGRRYNRYDELNLYKKNKKGENNV